MTRRERRAEVIKRRGEACAYAAHWCVTHNALPGDCDVDRALVAKNERITEVKRLCDEIRHAEGRLRAFGAEGGRG